MGGHAGGDLEELTRQKGTTWRKAWEKKRPYLDDKDIKRGAGVA
jgi:hypothetical protein